MKTLEEKRLRLNYICNKFHTTDKEDEELDMLLDDIELYEYMKTKGDFEK